MLAVLTGGGTAGHINPALALAETLVDRGVDVRFAGTPNGREADLVPAAGIPFTPFEADNAVFDPASPYCAASGSAPMPKLSHTTIKYIMIPPV